MNTGKPIPTTYRFQVDINADSMRDVFAAFGDNWYCDNGGDAGLVPASEVEPIIQRQTLDKATGELVDDPEYYLFRFTGEPVLDVRLIDEVKAFLAGEPSAVSEMGVWDSDSLRAHACVVAPWETLPKGVQLHDKTWPRNADWVRHARYIVGTLFPDVDLPEDDIAPTRAPRQFSKGKVIFAVVGLLLFWYGATILAKSSTLAHALVVKEECAVVGKERREVLACFSSHGIRWDPFVKPQGLTAQLPIHFPWFVPSFGDNYELEFVFDASDKLVSCRLRTVVGAL
ncbi:MAG: hypothetical protein JST35_10170 [Armatimonadetes bacterium]|nr:hypothetical protein [Armatimonadota bacterium]